MQLRTAVTGQAEKAADVGVLRMRSHFAAQRVRLWAKGETFGWHSFIEDEDVKAMLRGSYLQKIKSSSWMKSRFYKLQEDVHTVWYDSQKILKSARSQIFSIDDIQEVRPGHQSEGMQRYAMEIPTDRCFTVIFKGRKKNLDLVASDAKEALHWIDGLNKLKKRDATMNKQERLDQWFQIHLQKADMDKDNKMTLNEVKRFMQMMNIHVDDMYAKELFTKSDKSKDGSLTGKEIEEFYKLVTEREEITTIFNSYSNKDHLMSMEKLAEFLRKEQRENATQEYAAKLIKSYEINVEARDDLFMTKDGFLFFLMSPEADIFNADHNQVYQDMTKPLNQYYISASHNTYLTKDQLEGPSSIEAYISALNRGCRCVELDCWDGKNGEPVIYHGYTLTSKILFKDVIQIIDAYAFKASQYPLILSLENHCDVEQQNVMAHHLKTILGNKLLTRTMDGKVPTHFPSPEQLKGMILVKGKRLNRLEDDQSGSADEVSDEDEAAEMEGGEEAKEKEKAKKVKLSKELSDLVIFCRSVHFNGFEDATANQVFYEMSSFVENKFNKLVQDTGTPFAQLNARQLSRIYPAGLRTDSSNYSAIDMWNVGCQIVALNFQTPGEEMDVYQAKFRENGFAGYNLKPKFLREKKPTFDPKNVQKGAWLDRKKLHVMIISAQQLPKSNMAKPSSAVDPLVTVEVYGVKEDNSQQVTEHINNNGFNPMWNTSFQFDVSVPELATIRFLLQDYDISSRNDFIGQFSLPLTSIQLGYRHIHLLSMNGDPLPSASLFVHIMIE
ncbi:1-phosphatidylinositol 4,5-bisphosphate phosphodiesterase delta-1 isoform X2 [Amblyraja radiata]|uniref:1-phosphatidylinositol 4,5-bisphosphate phosphodiesterase delta-1 isoform X2 n=1 Tax=Amblyraja radiata TaxID=386614 RepID=UPI0014032A1A|nr:1-phosphatidylinositol 4,5-bisphosphate phosphodiesterase delta-1 isoform X2 [Amblyraja radiata]